MDLPFKERMYEAAAFKQRGLAGRLSNTVHALCYEEVGNETGVLLESTARLFPLLSYLQRVLLMHRAKPGIRNSEQHPLRGGDLYVCGQKALKSICQ
jgi:hypothetical protein